MSRPQGTDQSMVIRPLSTYYVGFVDGLTYEGSEFVINARNDRLWRKAVDKCIDEAGHIGLSRLLDVLMSTIQ